MRSARNAWLYGLVLTLAAALSACGGGDTASGSAQTLSPRLLAPGDITWTQCAVEDGVCVIPGSSATQVRYGLNGAFNTRTASGSIACTNAVFGDPAPGADKICEYAVTESGGEPPPPPPPSGETWTKCADEGGVCTVSGTRTVRYGQNGTFSSRTATGSIGCNNEVFGDPLPGIVKLCEFATSGSEPPPPPPPNLTWTRCASEGGICSFSGTRQVRYGQNGTFAIRTATASVGCNNEVFGDPLPGTVKICDYASEEGPPTGGTVEPVAAPMTMSCADGAGWQCSGATLIRRDHGVGLTSSGVQVYGRSTSDMLDPNPTVSGAFGLTLATGGHAEMRLLRDAGGGIGGIGLLLNNLGLTWDGIIERPPIIETFTTTQGRVQLDPGGALVFSALPASSNLGFYDVASRGKNGTQANYANNRYFPRSGNPSRCNPPSSSCPTVETTGVHYAHRLGDWRSGGNIPDMMDAGRVHGDGDVHAGDALPGSDPPWLPGGSGYGVPFPGSKGYRAFDGWSYLYANLAAWLTQDTVNIGEWGALNEHNKNRRGFVAYGAVTDPSAVPTAGSASYAGFAYGWHAPNAGDDPVYISGTAVVTMNFSTRSATVSIQNTQTLNGGAPVPLAFSVTIPIGAAGQSVANYMTGPVDTGAMKGGLSGRGFGPVAAGGPAEVAGAFSLSDSSSGRTFIGGFIGRKQ